MTEPADLVAALQAAAAGTPDAVEAHGDEETSWSRAGNRFAVLRGTSVALRVGSAIAVAAVRTPDTSGSKHGPDWIAVAPADLDGPTRDRLLAWFAAAHRRAAD
jgi:hypothetical protein